MPQLQVFESKLLKKDVFGSVEMQSGPLGTRIVRNTGTSVKWMRPMARTLLRREARALSVLQGLAGVPRLLTFDGCCVVRSHIPGRPMQEGMPASRQYFRHAMRLLKSIHRHGVVHNDLAKEPNWLLTSAGEPAIVDFQLAVCFRSRGKLFRVLAYEDVRHLLKHKRTYCPQGLTSTERKILDRPALVSSIWRNSGKRVYLFVTRRVLGWRDREGAGDR